MNWLIDDVRRAWRYLSVQMAVVLAGAATMWDYVPAVQQYLDPAWLKYFAVAMIAARVLNQSPRKDKSDAGNP